MRPKVICHMASSIDGRLIPERWTPLANSDDTRIIDRLHERTAAKFSADGYLMGRASKGDFSSATVGEPSHGGQGPRSAHVARSRTAFLAVVFDPNGKLRYDLNTAGGNHIVSVLAESVCDDYLDGLAGVPSIFEYSGSDGELPAAEMVLRHLATVTLEAGFVWLHYAVDRRDAGSLG